MSGHPARWLAAIAAIGLTAAGLSVVAPAPARATSGITQSGPFEVGNLLEYANTDFEGTTGNWVSDSNATLTDDTSHSFLHDDSLLDTATAAGTSSFKLGTVPTAVQITVKPGARYRIGAYFKVPAASGQTVQFSLGCYDSSGKYLGLSNGTPNDLLSTTKWQYSEDDITVPASTSSTSGCTDVQGTPKVTLRGLAAGTAVNMDEVIFAPYRAALLIGAHGQNGIDGNPGYTAADWNTTNTTIGPLQSDKEFYGSNTTPLPGLWKSSSNVCYEIENSISNSANWPACVITYSEPESEPQIQAFFQGLPDPQMVIMVFHQEPEGDSFSGCPGSAPGDAANFVCYSEQQSGFIRQAANDATNVFVATDSSTTQYGSGTNDSAGTGCGYIVPTSYTDFYLADHYDTGASGMSLPNETSAPPADPADTAGLKWSRWLSCVQPINKPLGLAEYGLDCTTNPDQSIVTQEMAADDSSYLAAIPGATEPTLMWEYWYSASGIPAGPGCMFDNSGEYNGVGGIQQWQDGETQNGGG
jgi:Carbohydrate binding domain